MILMYNDIDLYIDYDYKIYIEISLSDRALGTYNANIKKRAMLITDR